MCITARSSGGYLGSSSAADDSKCGFPRFLLVSSGE